MILPEIEIATAGPGLVEITGPATAGLPGADGVLTLFVRHTSCSLLVQENADPDVRRDLQAWAERLAPALGHPAMDFVTHRAEGPDDMPAHIRAAHLPVSLSIPVERGRPALGTWQGIYLWEHRDRPRQRRVARHFG